MKPPEVKPLAHWQPFVLPFNIGSGRGVAFSGGKPPLRMAFFYDNRNDCLVGKVWFDQALEGPPGHVHGGISSFVLDEAMGSAAWLKGLAVVAKKLEIEFIAMTPVQVDLDVEALVESVSGKNVEVVAKIFDASSGQIYSKARGHFVRLPAETLNNFKKFDKSGYDFGKVKLT